MMQLAQPTQRAGIRAASGQSGRHCKRTSGSTHSTAHSTANEWPSAHKHDAHKRGEGRGSRQMVLIETFCHDEGTI